MLYGITGGNSLPFVTDGVLLQYNTRYSNGLDGLDGRKQTNTGENLSIKNNNKLLTIERRQSLSEQDTIFLNLTGIKAQNYYFDISASNLNAAGMQGYLEDTYLATRTPLNMAGLTKANFAVTNVAGSYAPEPFQDRIYSGSRVAGDLHEYKSVPPG